MQTPLEEWIHKAEEDYRSALLLNEHPESDAYDVVCFCCQQCVEKYFKALLVYRGVKFMKEHDLIYLLNLVLPHDPDLHSYQEDLEALSDYAVNIRYPGGIAGTEDAREAIEKMKLLRAILRKKLGFEIE